MKRLPDESTGPPDHLEERQLRDVDVGGYRLRTWDAWRSDRDGKYIVGYEFTRPDGHVLFHGEDFACSPLHAIDSDECLRGILTFLTLRRGDTDADYFEGYTPEQREFTETDAEELSLWSMAEEAPPFEDWAETSSTRRQVARILDDSENS